MNTILEIFCVVVFIWTVFSLIKPTIGAPFFKKSARKKIVGVFFITVIIFGLAAPKKDTPEQPKESTQKVQQIDTSGQKNKTEEPFHMNDVETAIQAVYDQIAQQRGTGTPTVDVSFANYAQWESAPGLIESNGTFTLSSEEGLTHKFSARWGKNSADLIRLEIDGQRIFYSEELQDHYMDKYDPQNK